MGYHPTTRCREYREGWLGRRRSYTCRECGIKFEEDKLSPLPEIDRVCPDCRKRTYVYTFVNKRSGKELLIRASDAELATVRAWKISPNLTFKVPQPDRSDQ